MSDLSLWSKGGGQGAVYTHVARVGNDARVW